MANLAISTVSKTKISFFVAMWLHQSYSFCVFVLRLFVLTSLIHTTDWRSTLPERSHTHIHTATHGRLVYERGITLFDYYPLWPPSKNLIFSISSPLTNSCCSFKFCLRLWGFCTIDISVLDTLRSTSLPQVKRYFRKRIVRCINECKTQALNMKKSIESSTGQNSRQVLSQNDYDFGWGSDFDEDDEDDDEPTELRNRITHANNAHSLSNLRLNETVAVPCDTELTKPQLSHSMSLQSFGTIEGSSNHYHRLHHKPQSNSTPKEVGSSSPLNNTVRRPVSEPPPPPLPKEPPPNMLEESDSPSNSNNRYISSHWGQNKPRELRISQNPREKGISEDAYEIMTASRNNCDDEYLLPNCAPSPKSKFNFENDEQENTNYEYIQYKLMDEQTVNSSDSGSILSSTSMHSARSNLKLDSEIINERPLPPIPKEETFEEMMLSSFTWFHDLEREEAESMLKRIGADGVYLVRKSRRAGASNPFTLTLFHDGKIFHLNVRKRSDGRYALGKEKHKEKTFISVVELVEHHNNEPIFLTSKGQAAGKTRLIYTPSTSTASSANNSMS